MERNKEYKQIILRAHEYNEALKGKVVDKVVFNDNGSYDTQFCIIMFTDKTYIAIGTGYKDLESGNDEPNLENYYVNSPGCVDSGCFDCHSWVDTEGNLHFYEWIQILKDLGLWIIDEKEAKKIIDRKNAEYEEREYQNYLRLKEKFEKKENTQ